MIFTKKNANNEVSTSESSSKIYNINNDENEEPGNDESENLSCHICENQIQNNLSKSFPSYKSFKGTFPTNTVPDTRLRFGNSGSCSRTRLRSYYVSSCNLNICFNIYISTMQQCMVHPVSLFVLMCY